ncbi:hypothetical protein JB92DRAFT_2829231 [Gautieria morchelliformis]|nr:hypothetical protein JB92DRAFT_2829231 [Gautieria morchelliformis]
MKVTARRRSDDLAREAWFYEEMEDIQGRHCYGFFTAEIESNSEVLDWAASDAGCDEEEVDVPDEDSQDDLGIREPTSGWGILFKRNEECEKREKLRQEHRDQRDRIIKATHAEVCNSMQ